MNLAQLRSRHPEHFHPTQDWYFGEDFLDTEVPDLLTLPDRVLGYQSHLTPMGLALPYAASLAGLYIRHPEAPLWRHYLWCADTDRQGQRVYVGDNGRGFEIHRHLHLTERFGIPLWS